MPAIGFSSPRAPSTSINVRSRTPCVGASPTAVSLTCRRKVCCRRAHPAWSRCTPKRMVFDRRARRSRVTGGGVGSVGLRARTACGGRPHSRQPDTARRRRSTTSRSGDRLVDQGPVARARGDRRRVRSDRGWYADRIRDERGQERHCGDCHRARARRRRSHLSSATVGGRRQHVQVDAVRRTMRAATYSPGDRFRGASATFPLRRSPTREA